MAASWHLVVLVSFVGHSNLHGDTYLSQGNTLAQQPNLLGVSKILHGR